MFIAGSLQVFFSWSFGARRVSSLGFPTKLVYPFSFFGFSVRDYIKQFALRICKKLRDFVPSPSPLFLCLLDFNCSFFFFPLYGFFRVIVSKLKCFPFLPAACTFLGKDFIVFLPSSQNSEMGKGASNTSGQAMLCSKPSKPSHCRG